MIGRLALALALALPVQAAAQTTVGTAAPKGGQFDDAAWCSGYFAEHGDAALPAPEQRRCMIAIAGTYIAFEEGRLEPDKILLADDVAKHRLGTPAVHAPGNAARIRDATAQSVIDAIRNRQWVVDGNVAWISYDGHLKADPAAPAFFVAERFTVEQGLIREILIARPVDANGEVVR